jgi:glycosyltransferase involved in cell wall biosynthesis
LNPAFAKKAIMSAVPPICITVLAHNEAARITACLNSLPLGDSGVTIHVVVNGSSDATAAIASGIAAHTSNVSVHIFETGGKARSWNRFLFDTLGGFHRCHIFVDGDAEVLPGSIAALARTLEENPAANAACAFPMNGRRMRAYQRQMREEHGLFGDLYALRGEFLGRMKQAGIRLPEDLVGDDGLVAALAKTDLCTENDWDDQRVVLCEAAGFLCAPVGLFNLASWRMQYRRMRSYSVRHFQNEMISKIMQVEGPKGLPRAMADLYRRELPGCRPRASLPQYWFDRLALKQMAAAVRPV